MIYDIGSCNYEKEIAIKGVLIEMLKKKLTVQTELLTDAITYGFKRNQENVKLLQRVRELESSQKIDIIV
jgi:hypothetical protein